jgi:hypothetical protein
VCCPLTKLCVSVGVPCTSPSVCADSEYCCPDAKHCLTPTNPGHLCPEGGCGSGEVCCPLTNLCVKAAAPCDPADEKTIPTTKIGHDHLGDIELPMAGLGTWLYNDSHAQAAVTTALALGYSHIDTAFIYGNAAGIGAALKASGRARESYFLTSKVMGGNRTTTLTQHEETLKKLGVAYVDLLLVHFPGTFTPSGAVIGSRAARQEQWRALEELVDSGAARAIGVSHYCKRHLQDILDIAKVPVAVNQVQYHGDRRALLA